MKKIIAISLVIGLLSISISLFTRTDYEQQQLNRAFIAEAKGGHVISMNALLLGGANIDYRDPDTNMTAIMFASRDGNIDAANLLIDNNADLELVNPPVAAEELPEGQLQKNAIMYAIESDNPEIVTILLEAGANPNSVTSLYVTPLRLAVRLDNAVIVSELLKGGSDPYTENLVGQSVLDLAIERRDVDVLIAFLQHFSANQSAGGPIITESDSNVEDTVIHQGEDASGERTQVR